MLFVHHSVILWIALMLSGTPAPRIALAERAGMPDLPRLTRKLERRRCSLADLWHLYTAVHPVKQLAAKLEEVQGEHATLLRERLAIGCKQRFGRFCHPVQSVGGGN